ncbi:hypothetical protein GQ53DRAFT_741149 [Thozetella sp. PMI_491]|nr:hypothetical protein GQ53DRAFT_741149 [Thozetella sp. PMI_491]
MPPGHIPSVLASNAFETGGRGNKQSSNPPPPKVGRINYGIDGGPRERQLPYR